MFIAFIVNNINNNNKKSEQTKRISHKIIKEREKKRSIIRNWILEKKGSCKIPLPHKKNKERTYLLIKNVCVIFK